MILNNIIYSHMEQKKYKIQIKKGNFLDSKREKREIPFKIYAPKEIMLHKLPVILWSHGLGGSRDGAGFIARYLAEHGYIVVNIQHHGTDSTLWEGKESHPWDIILSTPITRDITLDRFYDVSFALDELEKGYNIDPALYKLMDFDHVGMSGHSFGALTTQVITGQLFPNEQDLLTSYHDPRFKAAIAYSPVGIAHLTDAKDKDIYSSIAIPVFYMTGTKDKSPASGRDYTRCLHVHDQDPNKEKKLLVLENGDHMIFSGSRGKLASNPRRDAHEDIIKEASLAFWDYHLKNDKNAALKLKELIIEKSE